MAPSCQSMSRTAITGVLYVSCTCLTAKLKTAILSGTHCVAPHVVVGEHTHHLEGGALWMTAFMKSLQGWLVVRELGKARVVQLEGELHQVGYNSAWRAAASAVPAAPAARAASTASARLLRLLRQMLCCVWCACCADSPDGDLELHSCLVEIS